MYGISVKNDSGHILISSDVTSLHYGGNATLVQTLLSGLNEFAAYYGDDGTITLSGRHVHRYSFVSQDAPVFFIKPTNYAYFYGVLQQFQSGSLWYVDVIQSGFYSSPPTVKAFVTPRNLTTTESDVGIVAYKDTGELTFDSRLLPLALYSALAVTSPTLPCNGGQPISQGGYAWNDNTLDFDFGCNNTFNSYSLPSSIATSNLMFSGPSIAQAVYTRQKSGFKSSSGTYSSQNHWSTAVWWAMYNSAYRLQNNTLQSGWSVYAADYQFSSTWEGSGWYEFGGGGGSIQAGNRPFNDKTINLSSNTVMVADASVY